MAITRFRNSSIRNGTPKYNDFLAGLPFRPVIGTATAGVGQASVAFTANNPAGAGVTYTALSSPGNITATGPASPITVTGLSNGTAYTFQVRASNSLGDSAYSASSNSVTPTSPTTEYLVLAGGGAGGSSNAGGGGAGGYRSSVIGENSGGGASAESVFSFTLSTNYTVTIGAGGANTGGSGSNGSNTTFATITSTGGGGGAAGGAARSGNSGGSGGGSTRAAAGGAGTANQGYAGGSTSSGNLVAGGGGGGAAGVGGTAVFFLDPKGGQIGTGGARGNGITSNITGTGVLRGRGGAGGDNNNGNGASGGGANTGGGGGGSFSGNGLAGSSGVVILRYPSSYTITIGAGLTGSTATSGGNTVATITAGTGNVSWA